MGVTGDVEKRDASRKIGFVGVLMPFDLAGIGSVPCATGSTFFKEGGIHQPFELIDIHGVNAIVQPVMFCVMALDRFFMLAALIGMADVQRIAHPLQNLIIAKPPEQFVELRFKGFFAHMLAAAGRRVAQALIGVAGAVIIHVALISPTAAQPQAWQAIRRENAKSCRRRLALLAKRPSSTPCTNRAEMPATESKSEVNCPDVLSISSPAGAAEG